MTKNLLQRAQNFGCARFCVVVVDGTVASLAKLTVVLAFMQNNNLISGSTIGNILATQTLTHLSLHYLEAFVLSVELGSISAAARALGKRQSQLSGWIQELEIELNVELFIRSSNRLELSPAGHTLLPLAQHTLAQSSRLQAAALAFKQDQKLLLTVGVAPHIPQPILAEVIANFFALHPQVQLQVSTHSEPHLEQGVIAGTFDVVLMHESIALHNSRYEYCRVGTYDEIMVVRSSHPLAEKKQLSTADLAPFRELVFANEYQQSAEESGYSGHFSMIGDFPTLLRVLQKTDCIAMLPALMVEACLQQGVLVSLSLSHELSPIRRRLEVRWPLGSQHNSLVGSWLRLLQLSLSNQDFDIPLSR